MTKIHSDIDVSTGEVGGQHVHKVIDLDLGRMSVTNDAENVVAYVLNEYGPGDIIYRDSQGQWDRMAHDGKKFLRVEPLSLSEKERFGVKDGQVANPAWQKIRVQMPERKHHEYGGDGVYFSFDGYHIWLHLNSHDSEPLIALEPSVLASLNDYAARIEALRISESKEAQKPNSP